MFTFVFVNVNTFNHSFMFSSRDIISLGQGVIDDRIGKKLLYLFDDLVDTVTCSIMNDLSQPHVGKTSSNEEESDTSSTK